MKLAVYGTLRNGNENIGRVKNTSLVYPGHQKFPAMIKITKEVVRLWSFMTLQVKT